MNSIRRPHSGLRSSSWALWARDRPYAGLGSIKMIPHGSKHRAITDILASGPLAQRQLGVWLVVREPNGRGCTRLVRIFVVYLNSQGSMGAHARQLSRLRLKSLCMVKPEINGEVGPFWQYGTNLQANFQPTRVGPPARQTDNNAPLALPGLANT